MPGLKDDSWGEVVAAYQRASQLTGLVITIEGQNLEMRNPWDPEPSGDSADNGRAADSGV